MVEGINSSADFHDFWFFTRYSLISKWTIKYHFLYFVQPPYPLFYHLPVSNFLPGSFLQTFLFFFLPLFISFMFDDICVEFEFTIDLTTTTTTTASTIGNSLLHVSESLLYSCDCPMTINVWSQHVTSQMHIIFHWLLALVLYLWDNFKLQIPLNSMSLLLENLTPQIDFVPRHKSK